MKWVFRTPTRVFLLVRVPSGDFSPSGSRMRKFISPTPPPGTSWSQRRSGGPFSKAVPPFNINWHCFYKTGAKTKSSSHRSSARASTMMIRGGWNTGAAEPRDEILQKTWHFFRNASLSVINIASSSSWTLHFLFRIQSPYISLFFELLDLMEEWVELSRGHKHRLLLPPSPAEGYERLFVHLLQAAASATGHSDVQSRLALLLTVTLCACVVTVAGMF